jgi:DNA-binding transcriptional LysR family regulator
MDKLKQIEAFIAVVEHGSMAAAALTQNVTPVMIGRRINALEARIGVKLLHRSTRRIVVTEQGAAFMEQCKKALADLDRAEMLIAEGKHKATGHLIVSAPAAFGRKHVAPHAPAFLAANPEVQISFNLTDRVVDLVREAMTSASASGRDRPELRGDQAGDQQARGMRHARVLARHGVPHTLEDLEKHNCLAFNLQGGQQRGWYFQQNGKTVTVRVNGNLDCNDGELLHRWTGESLGLGWRSTWEILPQLESGELITVLDEYALPDYDILAVYPQQRPVPAKIRFFIEHLKQAFAKPGYWSGRV